MRAPERRRVSSAWRAALRRSPRIWASSRGRAPVKSVSGGACAGGGRVALDQHQRVPVATGRRARPRREPAQRLAPGRIIRPHRPGVHAGPAAGQRGTEPGPLCDPCVCGRAQRGGSVRLTREVRQPDLPPTPSNRRRAGLAPRDIRLPGGPQRLRRDGRLDLVGHQRASAESESNGLGAIRGVRRRGIRRPPMPLGQGGVHAGRVGPQAGRPAGAQHERPIDQALDHHASTLGAGRGFGG
jgi:hypothetical protein